MVQLGPKSSFQARSATRFRTGKWFPFCVFNVFLEAANLRLVFGLGEMSQSSKEARGPEKGTREAVARKLVAFGRTQK